MTRAERRLWAALPATAAASLLLIAIAHHYWNKD